ncbi:DUF1295 domain-containing protein [Allorhodopirellula solitaria]|uniref:3-oxo-5-alpha-steroid 4-dehydrogenase n=1 Tax=Allorhodopirellula solitaria TaxID=2527987 RepID=A0A5C5XQW4_9BACT|nr:DUF1295 domain-containing protein [Allorhodopirellula solitaria]TWT64891.1 3-oxo-5-alpha-steroid 4-dehydrogenase [Allorhodopirellula solitaria]
MIVSFTYCAAVIGVLMVSVWLVSLYRRDVSIIDIVWGLGFVLVAWTAYAMRSEPGDSLLVPVLTTIWGLRLSAYLGWRNHGQGEDPRYQKMRSKWGDAFPWVSLLTVFGVQAAVMWVVSLPLQSLYDGADDSRVGMSVFGVILFSVGLFFEAVGDWQLARFKANPTNAGQVMDQGLWRYTRHPNYFGDFLVWWGLFFTAYATSHVGWAIIGPIVMSIFLMRVSGVTLLEKSLEESKPGYREYVERTNAFFPGWRSVKNQSVQ